MLRSKDMAELEANYAKARPGEIVELPPGMGLSEFLEWQKQADEHRGCYFVKNQSRPPVTKETAPLRFLVQALRRSAARPEILDTTMSPSAVLLCVADTLEEIIDQATGP